MELRILVVDGDAGVRGFIRAVLEGEGCDVVGVETVRAAIGGLDRINTVLTSLQLPDGDGLDVLAAARSRAPAAHRLLMTSGLDASARDRAQGLVEEILLKPLDRATLIDRVVGRSPAL